MRVPVAEIDVAAIRFLVEASYLAVVKRVIWNERRTPVSGIRTRAEDRGDDEITSLAPVTNEHATSFVRRVVGSFADKELLIG